MYLLAQPSIYSLTLPITPHLHTHSHTRTLALCSSNGLKNASHRQRPCPRTLLHISAHCSLQLLPTSAKPVVVLDSPSPEEEELLSFSFSSIGLARRLCTAARMAARALTELTCWRRLLTPLLISDWHLCVCMCVHVCVCVCVWQMNMREREREREKERES